MRELDDAELQPHPHTHRGGVEMKILHTALAQSSLANRRPRRRRVAALFRLARDINAATRHAVWWAVLAVIVLLPIPRVDRPRRPACSAGRPRSPPYSAPVPAFGRRRPARSATNRRPPANWPAIVLDGLDPGRALAPIWPVSLGASRRLPLPSTKRDSRPAEPDARSDHFDAGSSPAGFATRRACCSPRGILRRWRRLPRPAVILPEDLLATSHRPLNSTTSCFTSSRTSRAATIGPISPHARRSGFLALHPVALVDPAPDRARTRDRLRRLGGRGDRRGPRPYATA